MAEALPALFIWGRAGSRPGFWRGVPDRREGASPIPLPGGGVLIRAPDACLGQMMVWKTCSSAPGSVALFAKDSFEGRLTW